jgi:hypothetical protein
MQRNKLPKRMERGKPTQPMNTAENILLGIIAIATTAWQILYLTCWTL